MRDITKLKEEVRMLKRKQDVIEKKELLKSYSNLIYMAVASLIIFLAFWYSTSLFERSMEQINFKVGILTQTLFWLKVTKWLSLAAFLVFVVLIILKRYGLSLFARPALVKDLRKLNSQLRGAPFGFCFTGLSILAGFTDVSLKIYLLYINKDTAEDNLTKIKEHSKIPALVEPSAKKISAFLDRNNCDRLLVIRRSEWIDNRSYEKAVLDLYYEISKKMLPYDIFLVKEIINKLGKRLDKKSLLALASDYGIKNISRLL